jgi:hypothetical protein
VTNTLAYQALASVMEKKSFVRISSGKNSYGDKKCLIYFFVF